MAGVACERLHQNSPDKLLTHLGDPSPSLITPAHQVDCMALVASHLYHRPSTKVAEVSALLLLRGLRTRSVSTV